MTVMGHQSFFETEKSPQTRMNTKKNVPDSKIRHIIWWERMDSDHRSRKTTDLQSAPFGHSGTPPNVPLLLEASLFLVLTGNSSQNKLRVSRKQESCWSW